MRCNWGSGWLACKMFRVCLFVLSLSGLLCVGYSLTVNVSEVSEYTKLRSWKQSTLFRVEINNGSYESNPLLLQLIGSRYDMGYAYGYLLSDEIAENYFTLLHSLISGSNLLDQAVMAVLEIALDWQWKDYLSKELPVVYQRELMGVADGAAAKGCTDCGAYVTRAITLANAPGDTQDFLIILIQEFLQRNHQFSSEFSKLMQLLFVNTSKKHNLHCSMFAVWGNRSLHGQLYSARNLDWNKDTGMNKFKLVMVTVPDDGSIPSASVGFVGLYGALAGMSAKGLTLHEANLEELQISFMGFPWVLRIRFIMEYAKDLVTARELWASTNNTVGFNHMVASAPDALLYRLGKTTTVALAMETMYQYTAYFADNDTREAEAMSNEPEGNVAAHIGFPLPEAVWRTNHGYDPLIRKNYEWSQSPKADSIVRYMLIHDALQDYHAKDIPIGIVEALNITAIVGNKGEAHPYQCMNNTDGTNVLSVTFQPEAQILYSAWERSSGSTWRPAVCSTYIKFNLTSWFAT